MKGEILPGSIPTNRFQLQVLGLIPIYCTKISGLEDELVTTKLPDRTVQSGGVRDPTEITITTPMHHVAEQAAMELWYRESQEPVLPTYKKPCTLMHLALTDGSPGRNFTLVGVFPKKRKLPDLDKSGDGEMSTIDWTLSVDDVFPI